MFKSFINKIIEEIHKNKYTNKKGIAKYVMEIFGRNEVNKYLKTFYNNGKVLISKIKDLSLNILFYSSIEGEIIKKETHKCITFPALKLSDKPNYKVDFSILPGIKDGDKIIIKEIVYAESN